MAHEPSELVVGADGTVGSELLRTIAANGRSVAGTTRRAGAANLLPFDLAAVPRCWNGPPISVAYICAAITNMEACNRDPAGTARVNVDGTLALAEMLVRQGAYVIFLSSNQVFDGSRPQRTTDEPTCPFNEYGRQKAETERRIRLLPNTAVLRLTKVVGGQVPVFEQWIASVGKGTTIRPFVDLTFAPIKVERAVEACLAIGERRQPGIYHLSGDADLSYYQAAKIGLSALGADDSLIGVGHWRDFGSANLVPPRFTSLEASQIRSFLQGPIETSVETVRDYFARRKAA